MIYFINFGILFMAAFFSEIVPLKELKGSKHYVFIMLAFYLYLFAALRVDTGYDYESYETVFYRISEKSFRELLQGGFFEWMEPGYVILNFICKLLSFRGFMLVATGIAMLPKLIFIRKYCNNYLSVLLFYYCTIMLGFDMGVLRQGIATGLSFWAIMALKEKKNGKFLILTGIAASFHTVSLILVVLLIYDCSRKYDNKFYFYLIIVGIVVSLCHPISIIEIIVSHVSSYLSYKLYVYRNSYHDVNDNNMTIYLSVIKRLIIFLPLMLFVNWNKYAPSGGFKKFENAGCIEKKKSFHIVCFNAFFLSIFFSLCLVELPVVAGRGTGVFQSVQIFLLPLLIDYRNLRFNMKDKLTAVFANTVFSCYVIGMVTYNMISTINEKEYLHYCSILGS